MKRFLWLFCFNSFALANTNVYFTEDNKINFARKNFYQQIETELKNIETKSKFFTKKKLSRVLLEDAHPPVNLSHKNKKLQNPKHLKRMILPIQKDLESQAKSSALIVDCFPYKSTSVLNCGIYRYSREKAKVDSSSVRYFSVNLENPEKWATYLVENFVQNSANEQERSEAKLMSDFLKNLEKKQKKNIEEVKNVTLSFSQQNIFDTDLSGLKLQYGQGDHNRLTTISFEMFNTSKDQIIDSGYEASIGAKNYSNLIHNLRWEIDYKASYSFWNKNKSFGQISSLSFNLSPSLSIAIDKKKKSFITTSYRLSRYMVIDGNEKDRENNFWNNSWSLGYSRVF